MPDAPFPAEPRAIALWSAPRSRSTAFLRMAMEIKDLITLHEPFSHRADFGQTEVDGRVVTGEHELTEAIVELGRRKRVFFKDTTDFRYPAVFANEAFLTEVTHTFILRDPAEVIASHCALNPDLTADEVGFGRLHEIFHAVAAATGRPPVVVDSDLLLDEPEAVVRAYCAATGLEFTAGMLSWQPAERTEWKRASRWHTDAAQSSGFVRSQPGYARTVANDPILAGYDRDQRPYYEELLRHRITVPDASADGAQRPDEARSTKC